MQKIIKLQDVGFCYGVKRSIELATQIANDPNIPRPIYLLGNLVHNRHITTYLTSIGIITLENGTRLEMLNEIQQGTVVITAHGVAPSVIEKAKSKNLYIVDTTCPYVKKTFEKMEQKISENYDIIFIGKDNHPETEAAKELSKRVHIISELDRNLPLQKVALCHQTTFSSYDIDTIYQELLLSYPHLEKLDMVCKVTEKRQQALLNLQSHPFLSPSLILVVGDSLSNNSTKLVEMAKRIGKSDVLFVSRVEELDLNQLKQYQEIWITSGTSTPSSIVDEIERVLLALFSHHQKHTSSQLHTSDYIK